MQCRKIGNRVTIRGACTRASGPPGPGGEVGVLPAGFRPPKSLTQLVIWTSASDFAAQHWTAFIYADGRLNAGFTYNQNPATPANGSGNCGWFLSFLVD